MQKLKVLLISPSRGVSSGEPLKPKFQSHPMGLLYIASVLEKNNYVVKIHDAFSFGYTINEIRSEVRSFKPDVVGITAMTILANDAYFIAKHIKEINDSIITVMGGAHATAMPEEALAMGHIDYVVSGEGEHTMLDLCNAFALGVNDLSEVPGITYKNEGNIVKSPIRGKINSLDALPFPSYRLLPLMNKYNPPPHWGKKGSFASVLTSRGCPYGCMFCSVTRIWGRRYRFRSPEDVLDELEILYREYGVRYISFRDSVFTLHKKRVIAICKGILERNLKISWNCNGRVNEITGDMLQWMKKAGCRAIQYGLESGNEEILSKFKKLDKTTIRDAVDMTRSAGIESHGYFMFGLPDETRATMRDTIHFAKSLKLSSAGFTSVTPFPGSDLWDYCVEHNLILSQDWSTYDLKGKPPVKHVNLSSEEILQSQKKAFRKFYLRPGIILNFLKNTKNVNDVMNYFYEAVINMTNVNKAPSKSHREISQ